MGGGGRGQRFPDPGIARKHAVKRRWNNKPASGACGLTKTVQCKVNRPMGYRFKDAYKHSSQRTGIVLAESHVSVQQ